MTDERSEEKPKKKTEEKRRDMGDEGGYGTLVMLAASKPKE